MRAITFLSAKSNSNLCRVICGVCPTEPEEKAPHRLLESGWLFCTFIPACRKNSTGFMRGYPVPPTAVPKGILQSQRSRHYSPGFARLARVKDKIRGPAHRILIFGGHPRTPAANWKSFLTTCQRPAKAGAAIFFAHCAPPEGFAVYPKYTTKPPEYADGPQTILLI